MKQYFRQSVVSFNLFSNVNAFFHAFFAIQSQREDFPVKKCFISCPNYLFPPPNLGNLYNFQMRQHLLDPCWRVSQWVMFLRFCQILGILQTFFRHSSDILQTSFRHLSDIFQTSFRHPLDILQTSLRHPSDILQTSFRHPSDILQTSFRVPSDFLQTFF